MLTANLAQILIQEAQEELDAEQALKNNKHQYKINKNVALGILRNKIPQLLLQPQNLPEKLTHLKNRIKKSKVAVVPDRAFLRRKGKHSRRKYYLPKKRAF